MNINSEKRSEQAPMACMMVILDNTVEEEESDAIKKGKENSTGEANIEGWIGQEEERTKVIQRP